MRTAKRVKQKMFYATYHEGKPIYATDEQGNIIYDVMPDGKEIPRITGESPAGYDKPVEFWNSITSELTEDELKPFGNESSNMAKITFKKGEFPFVPGVLIWKTSEIGYKGDEVDETTADYRIVGVQNTGRHFYKALLAAVV